MPTKRKPFMQILAEARKRRGYQQNELAKTVGIGPVQYNGLEKGKYYPVRKTLALLCAHLELNYFETAKLVREEKVKAYKAQVAAEYFLTDALYERLVTSDKVVDGIVRDM